MTDSTKKQIQRWLYGFVGGCLGGGASAVSAWMGMSAAKSIGIDVPVLNFKAMGVIFLSGVLTHAVAFLAKSPLPPLPNGDTQQFVRPSDAGAPVKDP